MILPPEYGLEGSACFLLFVKFIVVKENVCKNFRKFSQYCTKVKLKEMFP
jgi:hypothetical protein